ncbi:hypothetical protein ACE1TI_17420 [Alteribacillus sp. JSM 102045]|uniref:hypothetical protein n=1 Tax=Alteribacillus sp. JSM 102045 TaxID=1562101 RepID=UPI0035BF5410
MATKVKRRSHHILVEVRASFMTEEHLPVEADQGACAFVLGKTKVCCLDFHFR